MEHTKLNLQNYGNSIVNVDENGQALTFAVISSNIKDKADQAKYAAFIVKACNNHAQLVDALEKSLSCLLNAQGAFEVIKSTLPGARNILPGLDRTLEKNKALQAEIQETLNNLKP